MGEALRRRVLVVLCLTQITSWGVLYYAFPVMAPTLAADTGWSVPTVTAAFSGGLVVSALVGIPVGRWLDRFGPRVVMTVGSAVAVPAVVGIATARTFAVFLVAWLLAGVGMAGTLYPPAFAALTRWWGDRRVTALTALTLAAGLTSTIFGPLTAALLGALGWRATYLVLALVLAVVTVPGHLWGLRGPWPAPDPPAHPAHADPGRAARSRPFVLLTVALTGGAFTVYAVLVGQVPLVIERGMSTTAAAWTLGLGGVGQVLGRLSYGALARVRACARAPSACSPCAPRPPPCSASCPARRCCWSARAMLAGAARGIFTLLQATAVTDRWGTAYYGRLNGVLSAPSTLATALAPWAGAALAVPLGGYPGVFILLAFVALVAVAAAVGSIPRRELTRSRRCDDRSVTLDGPVAPPLARPPGSHRRHGCRRRCSGPARRRRPRRRPGAGTPAPATPRAGRRSRRRRTRRPRRRCCAPARAAGAPTRGGGPPSADAATVPAGKCTTASPTPRSTSPRAIATSASHSTGPSGPGTGAWMPVSAPASSSLTTMLDRCGRHGAATSTRRSGARLTSSMLVCIPADARSAQQRRPAVAVRGGRVHQRVQPGRPDVQDAGLRQHGRGAVEQGRWPRCGGRTCGGRRPARPSRR